MKDNKDDKLDNKKRKIEFRGKCENTNKWEYGLVGITKNGNFLINNSKQHFIDENTLGQFTGLYDKDGKKIYEGDIVEDVFDVCPYDVMFDEKRGGWYPFACGDGCGCCEAEVTQPEYCKVVGNIYENPELLGGSDEECDN